MYASRFDGSEDRKDLKILDYIRKVGEDYDDEKVFKSLYGDGDKNSFYRLKNRLTHELGKSLLLQHFDGDEFNNTLFWVALSKFFFHKNIFKVALFYLKKAEKQAAKAEYFELLEIIYSDYIRLSYEVLSIDPEEYIRLRKENSMNLARLRQIDDVLSVLSYRLKITQNFSPKENPVAEMLEKTIENFAQDAELKMSPALRFRVYQAVSRILLQRHDYVNLEGYLLKIYGEFTAENLFSRNNHETKLQVLTYIVNTLFKNDKMEESLEYAEKLQTAMEEFNRLHYDKYLFFYYNSLVINYSKLNLDKAVDLLEQMMQNEQLKSPFYEQFIYLNLAIFQYEKTNFKQSARYFAKLYLLPDFANADINLRFRVSIAELIVRFELQDFQYLEHRIEQVKKEFKALLAETSFESEQKMVELLKQMSKPGPDKKNKKLMAIVDWFRANKSEKANEEQLINFNEWIGGKF